MQMTVKKNINVEHLILTTTHFVSAPSLETNFWIPSLCQYCSPACRSFLFSCSSLVFSLPELNIKPVHTSDIPASD